MWQKVQLQEKKGAEWSNLDGGTFKTMIAPLKILTFVGKKNCDHTSTLI
jgi:hypothetical protein